MRVLVAGRHELAALVIEKAAGRFDLSFTIGTPERRGRGPGARETARRLGVPIIEDDMAPSLSRAIQAMRPDVLLSLGHPRIVSPPVFGTVARAANIHFGALPRYRGSWSIPQAILAGEPDIGITLHAIEAGIDDGPVIEQRFLPNGNASSCASLYDAAVILGADMAVEWLESVRQGRAPIPRPQDESQATYFPATYPGDFAIDWRQTWLQVSRYIRAAYFPPLPSAHSRLGDLRIEFEWPVIWSPGHPPSAPCGTIMPVKDGRIGVAILNGHLVPQAVTVNCERRSFDDLVRRNSWLGRRLN